MGGSRGVRQVKSRGKTSRTRSSANGSRANGRGPVDGGAKQPEHEGNGRALKPGKAVQMEIGSRLREIRREHHLTLDQVRADAEVSQPYLSKVETGRSLPHPDTFRRIAESIGVDEDELEELLEYLLFERDTVELEKMGYSSEVAQLAAALQRVDADARSRVLDAARELAPELRRLLELEAGANGGDPHARQSSAA